MLLTRRHLTPGRWLVLGSWISNCPTSGCPALGLMSSRRRRSRILTFLPFWPGTRTVEGLTEWNWPRAAPLLRTLLLLRLRDGILYREARRKNTGEIVYQFVVPLALRNLILEQLHNLRIVGHLGIAQTLARVQERYYWPCLATDVARWCASCSDCAARKGKPPPKRVPLCPLPVGEPLSG